MMTECIIIFKVVITWLGINATMPKHVTNSGYMAKVTRTENVAYILPLQVYPA